MFVYILYLFGFRVTLILQNAFFCPPCDETEKRLEWEAETTTTYDSR